MNVLTAKPKSSSLSITSASFARRGLKLVLIEIGVEGVQSITTLIDHRTKVEVGQFLVNYRSAKVQDNKILQDWQPVRLFLP